MASKLVKYGWIKESQNIDKNEWRKKETIIVTVIFYNWLSRTKQHAKEMFEDGE